MLKNFLTCFVSGLFLLGPTAQLVSATQQRDKPPTTEEIKIKVGKLGLGEKARATIVLKNGARNKGYVVRVGDDDFVMRDRQNDTATTIRYADVATVERNKGHSTAKHLGVGLGIGAGATVGVLFLIISRLD